jgi:uncharacterized protein
VQIDWNAFTPWASLAGGVVIGLAAVTFVMLAGRIAGIAGIVGGLLRPVRSEVAWRLAFIAGLVVAPLLYATVAPLPPVRIEAGTGVLVIAGLLVGWGSRFGSGCTSGHGVCGLARRSPRSLVATLTFMAAGFLTVFLARHAFA